MLRKIKNLFLFLSLILLGIFSPLHFALAGWVGDLILFIPTRVALLIVRIVVEFAIFIVGLAGSILNWVLSPGFISFSYTKPGPSAPDNPVIEAGLGVTRGFVNMLLVLILIYIAIATILRLAGYETKKLLVTFIIVALLVNFAPVICGLIVDASNIIMNFFVQDLKADAFGKTMGAQVSMIMSGFSWMTASWEQASSVVMQLLIMNSFLLVLTLILLLFTVVFMLRHLVIWVLVILSPLAFVCYILPATRDIFKQWWKQFLAWSFIGVTCGFFLYLGLLMVTLVRASIPSPTTGEDPLFNSILPYFVSVVFLGLGIVFGLQTSAMGASKAINIAETKGRTTAKLVGKAGRRAAGWTAEKIRAKTPEGMRRWGERQMGARKWGEGEAGAKGFAKRIVATALPIRYVRRGFGKIVGGGIVESQQRKIQETEKSIKDTDRTPALLKRYHESIDDAKRIGIVNKLIQKGDIDDAMNEEKFGASAIKKDEMKRLINKAKKLDSDKTLKKAFPHFAEDSVSNKELEEAQRKDPSLKNKFDLVVSKMKSADYKNMADGAIDGKTKESIAVLDAILLKSIGSHISQLIEGKGKQATDAIKERITAQRGGEQGTKDITINERLERYIRSGAGQAIIGIGLPSVPTHFEPDEKDNKGNIIKRGKPFKSGYLRQEDKLVYIDSEEKMRKAEIRVTPKTPPPSEVSQIKPIKGPTIRQEIRTSKTPTIGQEIKKEKKK